MTDPWIVIADGQRARIVRLLPAPHARIEEVLPFDWFNAPLRAHAPDTDALGSGQAAAGSTIRHGVAPRQDPRRQLKQAFAEQLAEHLNDAVANHRAPALVLIAAPAALGDIRAALSAAARARVVREIDKDLTAEPDDKLARHLETLLA